MKRSPKFIVVGGEVAGLAATLRLAERGAAVQLFSTMPAGRALSADGVDGFNGASNAMGEGDAPRIHFEATIRAGDFLANQELPRRLCDAAPGLIDLFDRMGVAFDRTPEGRVDFSRGEGSRFRRTAFAGDKTGLSLASALDGQVRRYEKAGLVERFAGWEFVSAVLDGRGICRGLVAQNLTTMAFESYKADAVLACTGGAVSVFGSSSAAPFEGFAAAPLYRQGASYANGEFVHFQPAAIHGADKARLIPDVPGGRFWVPRQGSPWYFLEEGSEAAEAPTHEAVNRAIHKVIYELNLGIDGEPAVYLDFTGSRPKGFGPSRSFDDFCMKFARTNPREIALKVSPAVRCTQGGLWTDDDHMTNIPGVFAAGECCYQYHGAALLDGNALPARAFGGFYAADRALEYASGLARGCDETDEAHFINESSLQRERFQGIVDMSGPENPRHLREELGRTMTEAMSSVRNNAKLKSAVNRIREFKERFDRCGVSDKSTWMNQEAVFSRRLRGMLDIAHVMTLGALLRDESRGNHHKPEFPERDDEKYLKTTKARYGKEEPLISYEDVDTRHIKPAPFPFGREKKAS